MTTAQQPTVEQFGDDHDSQVRLSGKILEAIQHDDDALHTLLLQQLIIPAEALMAVKKTQGSQWIRDHKLRTGTAEKKYGKDWLDQ